MASKTFAEKMFAMASGEAKVSAGDAVHPDPELVIIHDGYLAAAHKELRDLGYRRIVQPERLVGVTDHEVVYTSPRAIVRGQMNRNIMAEWKGGRLFDAGQGGHGHIFPMESGLVRPGSFVIAYDMHASNFGAIGAYALTVGTDITTVLATGTRLTIVPETILVTLEGDFPPGVHPRDLGFQISHGMTSGRYGLNVEAAVVEFQGSVDHMSPGVRTGMINTLTEVYAASVLFPPMTFDGEPVSDLAELPSSPDANFRGRIDIDLADTAPSLALPGSPDNAADIAVASGLTVNHAYIGACGSSQYEDLRAAAEMLRGKQVARGVRLFVVPGTVQTAGRLMREGIAQVYLDAGAMILPAGCGPCAGGVMAPVGPGEVSISTAATNTAGRMGAMDAEHFLGSPLTVAASAIAGKITDPREMLA